jgi:hypothetical protein
MRIFDDTFMRACRNDDGPPGGAGGFLIEAVALVNNREIRKR